MEYFSNKPGPTPGTQLPRPNSNKIVPQKEENMSLKRKIQAQGGKISTVFVNFHSSLVLIILINKCILASSPRHYYKSYAIVPRIFRHPYV